MPEGHTIHRAARLQAKHFAGESITAWSPQGRFAEGASRIHGQRLESIEAWGKHLFYHWESGEILHVHLGLFGKFRLFATDPPEPTTGTRLAMQANGSTLYLAGPTDCSLITGEEMDSVVARLGPDPLRPDRGGADEIARRLARRTIPISAALMDQSIVAGIGNVYRAEILFLHRVDPFRPSNEVERTVIDALWQESRLQLRAGERSGRIVTVDPTEVGARSRSTVPRGERTYVYRRNDLPCRRCGATVRLTNMKGRNLFWCPVCQR